MSEVKKFKITIRRVEVEEYEMTLENESIMAAFDEARQAVAARNKTSNIGQFHITKIENEKDNDES